MLKNKSVQSRDDLYSTAHEIHYIEGLGTHQVADAQAHLEDLSSDDRRVVMPRIAAGNKRANSARARGLTPPQPPRTKTDWLRAYINTSALRREWGAIDQAESVGRATVLLRERPGAWSLPEDVA